MATIKITIETDNAAFSDGNKGAEVARILRGIATSYEEYNGYRFAKVYDSNGNAVGTVRQTGKDRD